MQFFKRKLKLCHLFDKSEITSDDLENLEDVETFYSNNHNSLKIKKCNICNKFFLYEFHEVIDWNEGNDEIYCTYVFADSYKEAKSLQKSNEHIRSMKPAIHWDTGKEIKVIN